MRSIRTTRRLSGCALAALVVTLFHASQSSADAVVEDAEAVLKAIDANEKNLKSWRGTANRVRTRTTRTDETVDGHTMVTLEQRVTFVWDADQDAVRATLLTARWRPGEDGRPEHADPVIRSHAEMRIGEVLYEINPLEAEANRNQRVTILDPNNPRRSRSPRFEPTEEFLAPRGTDVRNFLRLVGHAPAVHYERDVRRDGDYVTITLGRDNSFNRYVYDLASGGNLIKYEAGADPSDIEVPTRTIEIEYQAIDGVFLPRVITDTFRRRQHDAIVVSRDESRFEENQVNGFVDASEFSLEALGAVAGDLVVDERTGTRHVYDPGAGDGR